MKITSVDIIDVANDFQTAVNKWRPVTVRINTDEGISGYGEIGLAYAVGASAGFGMAKDLAKIIIGMDPMNIEQIWNKMQKKTFWWQGGGTVVSAAMSAIDIAFWDLKGQTFNVPVYKLLGGKTRESIRTYASQLQFGWGKSADKSMLTAPEQYAEAALTAVSEGFDAFKVDPLGMDEKGNWNVENLCGILPANVIRRGYERLRAMREAVGPDVDIIVELHAFTDTTAAIQFGKVIEELGIFYYEEPVMPLNPDQMKKVADNVNIPLASGERIYTRWGYRPFFENGALSVIQPDLGLCGGISEAKKICDMAYVYDMVVQGHVCGEPLASAAALHLETVIPNFIIDEQHRYALLEPGINTSMYDYQPVNGQYQVPELPGLGQALTEETLKKSYIETVKSS